MEAVANQVKERPEDARWHGLSPLVYGGLAALAEMARETRLYLHTDISADAGMVLVPLAPVLRNLERFWRAPESDLDLVFATHDAGDGLWLAWQDHWVELWLWGRFRGLQS